MGNVVDDKDATSVLHEAMVMVVGLEIDREKRCVPVISNKHQVPVPITHTSTWHVPWHLSKREI